jgi:hypothetical protein
MEKYTYRQINKHKRILEFSEYELDKYFGKEENIEPSFYCAFIDGNYKVAKIIYDKHKNIIDISKHITNIFGCEKTTLLHLLFSNANISPYYDAEMTGDRRRYIGDSTIVDLFNLIYGDRNLWKILQQISHTNRTPLEISLRGFRQIHCPIASKIVNHPTFTCTLEPAIFFGDVSLSFELKNIIKESFEKSMNDYPSVVRNYVNHKDGNTLLIKVLKVPSNWIAKDQYFRLISNENVNIRNKKGKTALYYAFRNNDHEMVKSLLEHGAIFDDKIKKKYKVKSYEMEQVLKSFNLF